MNCILCLSSKVHFYDQKQRYKICANCNLIFLDPMYRLDSESEKQRYLLHNNKVEDERYQNFVRPIIDEIKNKYPKTAHGLDFGAGTGPVGAYLFEKEGYRVEKYDPFFWPDKKCLELSYDFIFSCEVIEHFYDPRKEFFLLRSLLKETSSLILKTVFLKSEENFETWYYKNDPTHVCFYSEKTMQWIQKEFRFLSLEFKSKNLICLNVGVGDT